MCVKERETERQREKERELERWRMRDIISVFFRAKLRIFYVLVKKLRSTAFMLQICIFSLRKKMVATVFIDCGMQYKEQQ